MVMDNSVTFGLWSQLSVTVIVFDPLSVPVLAGQV